MRHYDVICIQGRRGSIPGIWHVIENSTNQDEIIAVFYRRDPAVEYAAQENSREAAAVDRELHRLLHGEAT